MTTSVLGTVGWGGSITGDFSAGGCTPCDYYAHILAMSPGPDYYWPMNDAAPGVNIYDEIHATTNGSFSANTTPQQTGLIDNTGVASPTNYSILLASNQGFWGPIDSTGTSVFPDEKNWTIEYWLKPTAYQRATLACLVDLYNNTNGILLFVDVANGWLRVDSKRPGGAYTQTPLASATFALNVRHHVALIADNNVISVWLDGVKYTAFDGTTYDYVPPWGHKSSQKNKFNLMRSYNDDGSSDYSIQGYIDQVAAYFFAVSDDELLMHYKIGRCQDFNPC